ncbi:hypothetical protein [Colwellia sp. 6M3]|uniref:hypothetical protein n=1 Tax=Colwellia sp. 6M3 TaxID=2759849 RepID=UPI0015F514B1|nr:hypothetical protein [Colwellia sp. 6M3]
MSNKSQYIVMFNCHVDGIDIVSVLPIFNWTQWLALTQKTTRNKKPRLTRHYTSQHAYEYTSQPLYPPP